MPQKIDQFQHIVVQAAAGWKAGAGGAPVARFWIVGEVADRIPGADLDALVADAAGQTVGSGHARVQPGATGALVTVVPAGALAPGDYVVEVTTGAGEPGGSGGAGRPGGSDETRTLVAFRVIP